LDRGGDWQSKVRAAWNSQRGSFASALPAAVIGKKLSDQTSAPRMGVCHTLNRNTRDSPILWTEDGPGNFLLSAMDVRAFDQVAAQDAVLGASNVSFPFGFGLLDVPGQYRYAQPCIAKQFGKERGNVTLDGNGTFREMRERGVLSFDVLVLEPDKDPQLQLTGVTVDGLRTCEIKPHGQPANEILRWLADFLSSAGFVKEEMKRQIESVFRHTAFAKDMIDELNRLIGHSSAGVRDSQ
jgi:hypothetical protein